MFIDTIKYNENEDVNLELNQIYLNQYNCYMSEYLNDNDKEFYGWYLDASCTIKVQNLKADKEYSLFGYQKNKETTHNVNFETNCDKKIEDKKVISGNKIDNIEEITNEGYSFGGWYLDSDFTQLFDINTVITKDITLYAMWNKVENYTDFSVHFLQLNNYYAGDCIYIKAGEVDILIDGGSRESSLSAITNYVNRYCTDGILEYVIVTHGHQDHIACFGKTDGLFSKYEVETIIDFPKTNSTSQVYERYLLAREAEIEAGAKHYDANECVNGLNGAQKVYQITEDVSFEILEQKYYYTKSSNENDYSVCVLFKSVNDYFLFTGDLEKNGEQSLVELNDLPEVTLYKAGHHGSSTSSNDLLLSVIKPKIIVVTCCAGTDEYSKTTENQFPTQDFIDRIAKYTDKVYIPSVAKYEVKLNGNTEYLDTIGFEALNGDVIVSSHQGIICVKCSKNDIILKDSEWFNTLITLNGVTKPMRVWPSNGA